MLTILGVVGLVGGTMGGVFGLAYGIVKLNDFLFGDKKTK